MGSKPESSNGKGKQAADPNRLFYSNEAGQKFGDSFVGQPHGGLGGAESVEEGRGWTTGG
jgi:hypothetical protein